MRLMILSLIWKAVKVMSRIDELIKEKCPDGVEYKKLEEVFVQFSGMTGVSNKWAETGNCRFIEYMNAYKNITIDVSKLPYATVKKLEQNILKKGDILFTSASEVPDECALASVIEDDIEQGIFLDDHLFGLRIKDEYCKYICPSYLKYAFRAPEFRTQIFKVVRGVTRFYISKTDFMTLEIPVPPNEAQQEIVCILDKFIELEAELQAELDVRKKQYDEYLNLLMDFSNDDSIKYMAVGELFEIKNGLNKEKDAFGKGKPIINFTDVFKKRYLINGNFTGLVDVDEEEIERYSAKKGDVFFTRTSETREDVGMSSTLIEDVEGCVFSGFVLRARPRTNLLLPKFCSYYFSTNQVRRTIMRYASFTTRATTTGPKLSKIMVPILSICEQQKIVDILDRMETICNDYEKGLPAEIEARHKQYEYYRDKLLTFERKVV